MYIIIKARKNRQQTQPRLMKTLYPPAECLVSDARLQNAFASSVRAHWPQVLTAPPGNHSYVLRLFAV
jgi:hypothetical protein